MRARRTEQRGSQPGSDRWRSSRTTVLRTAAGCVMPKEERHAGALGVLGPMHKGNAGKTSGPRCHRNAERRAGFPGAALCAPHHRSGMRSGSRLLLGDDLVLDGVIGVLGNDLLVHEFVLGLVRTALDDRLGPSRANLGQSIKLIFAGRVDVDEASLGRSRRGRGRRCGSNERIRALLQVWPSIRPRVTIACM